jgi:hypothetical protein
MTRVVIEDDRIIAALAESRDRTEICDSEGRVLGVFVPRSAEPASAHDRPERL